MFRVHEQLRAKINQGIWNLFSCFFYTKISKHEMKFSLLLAHQHADSSRFYTVKSDLR